MIDAVLRSAGAPPALFQLRAIAGAVLALVGEMTTGDPADEEAALAVARRVRAGEVKVNGSSVMSLHLFTPRPAWGISGYSEEGTAETLLFFTNPRVIGVENGFALHSRS